MKTEADPLQPNNQRGGHLVRLSAPLPEELAGEFLGKLHYVSESIKTFHLTAERDAVHFEVSEPDETHKQMIAGRISELADKLCQAYRPAELKILTTRQRPVTFDQDPHPLLEAAGELHPFGDGRFGFGPRLLALIEFFDREFFKYAEQFRAVPRQFPTLIGADILHRCRYLRTFPHSLTFVSHLREDLDAIQNFARKAAWSDNSLVCDAQDLAKIKCFLSPNVCFHCYAWLRDSCQPKEQAFTAVGKCFRYESGNLEGLERLWDFTMREWIFIGTRDYVMEQREKSTAATIALLDEWGLAYEIKSASDSVSVDEYSIATFQLAFDLKYEIQVPLPYKNTSLAVGSLNFHRDFFGRALNIETEKGVPANMVCAAFGLERLALAFLAQHGLDSSKWPAPVATKLTW